MIPMSNRRICEQRMFVFGALVIALLSVALCRCSRRASEPESGAPREDFSRDFDWDATAAKRPLFSTDYWLGWPSLYLEGREDWDSDLERIRSYLDPIVMRGVAANLRPYDFGPPYIFGMPDLLDPNPQTRANWENSLRQQIGSVLRKYRQHGIQVVGVGAMFVNTGQNYSPGWYQKGVKDWSELTTDGKPLSSLSPVYPPGASLEKEFQEVPCLLHPAVYQVADRYWEALSFLARDPVIAGFCVENEPALTSRYDTLKIGGNPHTQQAFRQFLRTWEKDIEAFNQMAGTRYKSFDEIKIGDPNWAIHAYASRFRASVTQNVYQPGILAAFRRWFPGKKSVTRLAPFWNLEWRSSDLSYVEKLDADYLGLSFFPGHPLKWTDAAYPERVAAQELLGWLSYFGSMLRPTGKPLALTELAVYRKADQVSTLRPFEWENLVYRGLYYNVRLFNLHSWARQPVQTKAQFPLHTFYGMSYALNPEGLHAVQQVRSEMERIAPYQTFGKPILPPLGILLSRNAAQFPGLSGALYGDWPFRLTQLLGEPEYSSYEIIEEHCTNLRERLEACKGIWVVDACLEPGTRQLLNLLAARGTKILAVLPPAFVGPTYRREDFPSEYPVRGYQSTPSMEALSKRTNVFFAPEGQLPRTKNPPGASARCQVVGGHPVLQGFTTLELVRPSALALRAGAPKVLALSAGGGIVAAAGNHVFCLAGLPASMADFERLLVNFSRWSGVPVEKVIRSPFEHATVVQNYDPKVLRPDGTLLDQTPWGGRVRVRGESGQIVWEMRGDFPWLAFHREPGAIVAEGVSLDPLEVKVFRAEATAALPHFEQMSDGMAFRRFWYDPHHIAGQFSVPSSRTIKGRLSLAGWEGKPIRWFLQDLKRGKIVTGARQLSLNFQAEANEVYLLVVVLEPGHDLTPCPLCRGEWVL